MPGLRAGLTETGRIGHFGARMVRDVYSARVMRFFGESLRQAGILILGSVLTVLVLVFALGLECGVESAYGGQTVGAPSIAGAFTALCDLREVTPYAFGYMMAAKVGTGMVAEIGSMRISEEIDALEVMAVEPMLFLCATRLLGMWLVLPFVYITAVATGFIASYLSVVIQIGQVSAGGYLQLFWQFQSGADLLFSAVKGMLMATLTVIVGCYYGYTAAGGPAGVGRATARSMVVNIIGVHAIGVFGTQLFWGGNARSPIGG